jgi:hypothetical protein
MDDIFLRIDNYFKKGEKKRMGGIKRKIKII